LKTAAKKSAVQKSSLGARKLLSTNTTVDVKIGSFESVERSTAKTAQELEDHKLALKVQDNDRLMLQSSGRVAALMAESEAPSTSIYRNPTSTGSSNSTSSAKNDGKAGSYSSSSG